MKVYRGWRRSNGITDTVEVDVAEAGRQWQLDPGPSQKIWNHSPDGFEWGYAGSGPAQLALALLLEVARPDEAQHYYQIFKMQVVAAWPREGWTYFQHEIIAWLKKPKEGKKRDTGTGNCEGVLYKKQSLADGLPTERRGP